MAIPGSATISSSPGNSGLYDCILLAILVMVAAFLFIGGLGFYTDDWAFLGVLRSSDASVVSHFAGVSAMRPVQALYQSALHWAFGLEPLGYHVVNSIVFASSVILLYLLLRRLRISRPFALAAAIVFAFYPSYSASRFWFAAFQINLSLFCYFVSLHGLLRTIDTEGFRNWLWQGLSLVFAVLACLAYEIVIPLFFLNALIGWFYWKTLGSQPSWRISLSPRLAGILSLHLFAVVTTVFYKFSVSDRLRDYETVEQIIWFSNFLVKISIVNFLDYGLLGPYIAADLFLSHGNWLTLFFAVALGVLTYLILMNSWTGVDGKTALLRNASILFAVGLLFYVGGYAIFLVTRDVYFNALTGLGNRSSVAGAVGAALVLVGVAAFAIWWLKGAVWARRLFGVGVAVFVASGLVTNSVIASFFARASGEQGRILRELEQVWPTLPEQATVIVDGFCPWIGPGVVFESQFDLAGALMSHLHRKDIRADVVKEDLAVGDAGITTNFEGQFAHYPYADTLIVYHLDSRSWQPMSDYAAAKEYFEAAKTEYRERCQQGFTGYGQRILGFSVTEWLFNPWR